jgi:hypothetical protein
VIVEGDDDRRILAGCCVAREQVIPVGGKALVLEAQKHSSGHDHCVFVVDCDYDVPAMKLKPAPNLIITKNTDAEVDLLELGAFRRVLDQLLPQETASEAQAARTCERVLSRVVAIGEVVGAARFVASTENIPLRFKGFQFATYRKAGSSSVARRQLFDALVRRSKAAHITVAQLEAKALSAPTGMVACHGKDLVESFADVLVRDFGVKAQMLVALPHMLRLAAEGDVTQAWSVIGRLREWEIRTEMRLLAA